MDYQWYEPDCELKGEPWPHNTILCDGKMCIICMDGEWLDEDELFVEIE